MFSGRVDPVVQKYDKIDFEIFAIGPYFLSTIPRSISLNFLFNPFRPKLIREIYADWTCAVENHL